MNPMPSQNPRDPAQPGDAGNGSTASRPSPSSADGGEQPFFRLDLTRSLHLHRRLAMGIALTGLVLAGVSAALKWPTYVAQSQVFIQPAAPQMMAQGGKTNWPNDTNSYDTVIQQRMQAVSHPAVLLSALHKLGPEAFERSGEDEQAAAARLGKAVEAKRLATSYQIEISAQSKDAELAAKIANSMATALVENAAQQEKSGDTERLAVLTAEQTRIQKELAADRAEQEQLNDKLGTASIGAAATNHYDQDIASIREELVKARAARDEAAARLSTMEAVKGATPQALNAEADELAGTDAGLVSMKMSLNQRRATLIAQMANLTPVHPLYKQDAAELAQIDSSLDAMMKDLRAKVSARIEQRMHTDLDRTTSVQDRLNGQLAQLAAAAAGATPQLQRAADLATNIARLQSRFAVVDEQVRDLTLEANAPGSAYLSSVASVPTHVAWALILKRSLLLAFGGVFLGLLAALIANNLDEKIYVAADVVRVLGVAPMVQLARFSDVSPGVAEDQMLRLTAAIDHACRQGNLKNCIFTGVGPGAGVTTIATRVQSMLQAMGHDSVLVDASGVLVKSVQAPAGGNRRSVALTTTEPGKRSASLMQQLAEEGESDECLILTDTAPLVISAETEYLARHVDAAIMVIEAGVTTRTQLRHAAETLQRLNVPAVGYVLNKVALATADAPFLHTVQAMEQHQGGQGRSLFHAREQTRPLAASSGGTEAPREDRSLRQAPAPELFRGESPIALPVETLVAMGLSAAEEESALESKLDRSVRPDWSGRTGQSGQSAQSVPAEPGKGFSAAMPKADAAASKHLPSEDFLQVQPLWTKQPQQRLFEPRPASAPVEAMQAMPRSPIADSVLTASEREELEAARLRVEASQARSQSQLPNVAPAPAPRSRGPVQHVPPIPPSQLSSAAVPVRTSAPLPVGRPIRGSATAAVQNQQQASLEEWVNFKASEGMGQDDGRRVQSLREPQPVDRAGNRSLPLSSLRDLSFGQALKNLSRPAELEPATPVAVPVPDIPIQKMDPAPASDPRPRPREPLTPAKEHRASVSRVSVPLPGKMRTEATSAAVTAQPEFLPPKTNAKGPGNESKADNKLDRRDRRDTFDDVEVLPSWRGQYKKR